MEYGSAPSPDEVEVSLFGPGYGEAVVVHLSDNKWLLIDSCINPDANAPASSHYLHELGVKPESVIAIVASHWHDDHVKGLSELVAAYPSADVFISAVFRDLEALAFVDAYGGQSSGELTRGTKELYRVVTSTHPVTTLQRMEIYAGVHQGRQVKVSAFSPTHAAAADALRHFVAYVPREAGTPIGHAPEPKTNLESIVVHVCVGDDALLLGADLEEHPLHGWSSIAHTPWCLKAGKASAYKVAHHGSATAEAAGIWQDLLHPTPIATVTPFNNGSVVLPKEADERRLKAATSATYISSGATRRPNIPRDLLKRMTAISAKLAKVNSGFGAVRLRKKPVALDWTIELFGDARRI